MNNIYLFSVNFFIFMVIRPKLSFPCQRVGFPRRRSLAQAARLRCNRNDAAPVAVKPAKGSQPLLCRLAGAGPPGGRILEFPSMPLTKRAVPCQLSVQDFPGRLRPG